MRNDREYAEERLDNALDEYIKLCDKAENEKRKILLDPDVLRSLCSIAKNMNVMVKHKKESESIIADYYLTWEYILPKTSLLCFLLGITFCLFVIKAVPLLISFV